MSIVLFLVNSACTTSNFFKRYYMLPTKQGLSGGNLDDEIRGKLLLDIAKSFLTSGLVVSSLSSRRFQRIGIFN